MIGNKKLGIVIFLIMTIFLGGCSSSINLGNQEISKETLPLKVANLSIIKSSDFSNVEDFQSFANDINTLIDLLNEQMDISIDHIEPTQQRWDSISRIITEYTPIVDNYNEVILTAKSYETYRTEYDLKDFYLASTKFSIELSLILGATYYSAAYKLTRYVYTNSGMTQFAFKCPTCVRTVLKDLHWTIRNYFVGASSKVAEDALEVLKKFNEGVKTFNSEYEVSEKANDILNDIKK